jgi:hypothetical protein
MCDLSCPAAQRTFDLSGIWKGVEESTTEEEEETMWGVLLRATQVFPLLGNLVLATFAAG